jgi:hypothetical protein
LSAGQIGPVAECVCVAEMRMFSAVMPVGATRLATSWVSAYGMPPRSTWTSAYFVPFCSRTIARDWRRVWTPVLGTNDFAYACSSGSATICIGRSTCPPAIAERAV